MNIEVLSIDGMSLAAEAWRLSRDVELPIEWEDIYTVDSPCNEMPSAFCHFHNFTILEREIFASSRTHVMWARTSFVDSPDKYIVPKDLLPYTDPLRHRELKDRMARGKIAGYHQDEWRRDLPVSAETSFVMRISYRDAIKYAKYFAYLVLEVSESLVKRFNNIITELHILIDKFTGSAERTEKAVMLMSLPKLLHEGLTEPEVGVDTIRGGVTVSNFAVPLWIRAHFVRHRPITIADNFFQLLKRKDCLDQTIDYPIWMTIAASEDIWKALLGKRSCWLTQSTLSAEKDPWQAIIEYFFDTFGEQILPCAGGVCPYHRDARNRLEGTDPGVPCLRYIDINGIDIEPHRARIEMALKSRGDFWKKMYMLHPTGRWPQTEETTDDHHRARVSK
jgi:hypothetical protein